MFAIDALGLFGKTIGPSVDWRRVDLVRLLSVLLVGIDIVRQQATTIELVRTRGI